MNERRQSITPETLLNDRYRIKKKIGAGGFSITYEAVDVEKDIQVAIKQFAPLDESIEWERERERFVREARILREFDYLEGVVSIRDVFENDNTAYLVMDYIDGITLKEYVKEYGTFSWDELVKMVTPVVRSLAKIHRRNVTHCDISPDNLMIGMDNKLWLIDFGASKHVDVKSERTVIIKQGYAPIEQYYSDGREADGKIGPWSDVYALSATMYMALAGEKPKTAVERMKNVDRASEIRVFDGILEGWQSAALFKGMAVNKSDRYENMEDFLEGISFPPNAKDDMTRVLPKANNSNKYAWLKIAGLLAVILIAIMLGLMLGRNIDSNRDYVKELNVTDEENTSTAGDNVTEEKSTITKVEMDKTEEMSGKNDTENVSTEEITENGVKNSTATTREDNRNRTTEKSTYPTEGSDENLSDDDELY